MFNSTQRSYSKPALNIYAFMALFGIFMAKFTKFDQWSVYGFDFFPKGYIQGFSGSTHFLSTFLVYFILSSLIIFMFRRGFISIYQNIQRKRMINSYAKQSLKWYQKIPVMSSFMNWYILGFKIWISNTPQKGYNFGYFIFFNFALASFDFLLISIF